MALDAAESDRLSEVPSRTPSHRPSLPSVRSTVTSAQFDPLLPFGTWRELGIKIARFVNSSPWWLGDWLLFGRYKYGRRYREAIEATGLDYQTLRNYAVVAR